MNAPNSRSPGHQPFPTTWIVVVGALCALVTLLEFAYEKHPHVKFESWFDFYGVMSILATLLICVISLALRNMLARSEEYYDG